MNPNQASKGTLDLSTQNSAKMTFGEELEVIQTERPRYGNMLVLLETDSILITLGPDYCCFIVAFICFLCAGIYLVIQVFTTLSSPIIKIVTIAVVAVQLLSYLLVAASNPGIALDQNMASEGDDQSQIKRYCKVCRLQMQRNMRHCRDCGVCIRDYDHHCPWTSKCIGGGNLKRFYFFVTITPIYIVFYMVMVLVCFANSVAPSPKTH